MSPELTITLLIVFIIFVFGVLFYESTKSRKKKIDLIKLKNEKDALKKRVEEKIALINKYNQDFEKYISPTSNYFNNHKLLNWKEKLDEEIIVLLKSNVSSCGLNEINLEEFNKLKHYFTQGELIRIGFNKKYIAQELLTNKEFFSNIDGKSLDSQQREAIVKDEDNNLVIAGAGSGKTSTVAGKVAYVINRLKVKPEEILLITFTKKASDEMKERIKNKMKVDIDVNTFHSFGRKIIGKVTTDMPSVIEEREYYSEMKKIFIKLFKNNDFAQKTIKFITEYRVNQKDESDFENQGEYINYLKDNNFKTYKTVETEINGKKTILREICKSLEEVQIANFLFLNGINYRYEEKYKYKTSDIDYAQYKPDFYLLDYDIYIEHFGLIDKNNNVPKWFSPAKGMTAKEKYNSDIAWKREIHKQNSTTLIETYSYENKSGVLLENLKDKLLQNGVELKTRSSEEIWEILKSVAKEDISAFDSLINTFLNLFKSNNFEISKLNELINKEQKESDKKRYKLFIEIFEYILLEYNKSLKSNHLIDFSDMINEATNYIREGLYKNEFKYIIIDEFQDTSIGRFNMIKALLDNNRSCKLFAVGDDWQSIYRFAGSDISLFTQFEKYFGRTEYSRIETTYRFSKPMIDISSTFILKNPNQEKKELKSFQDDIFEPIKIIESNSFRNDDPYPFITALRQINDETSNWEKKPKILALARYNNTLDLFKEYKDLFSVSLNNNTNQIIIQFLELNNLEVEFLSVHRSKGLEADYVIVLNVVSGQYGFPSEQADDPILNLLLSKSDQFINGEERRLFYVALTRSKKKTFITTNSTYRSKFISEIDPTLINISENKCPLCKNGDVRKQSGINKYGKPYIKYTCSNWNYGCEYLEWINS